MTYLQYLKESVRKLIYATITLTNIQAKVRVLSYYTTQCKIVLREINVITNKFN